MSVKRAARVASPASIPSTNYNAPVAPPSLPLNTLQVQSDRALEGAVVVGDQALFGYGINKKLAELHKRHQKVSDMAAAYNTDYNDKVYLSERKEKLLQDLKGMLS